MSELSALFKKEMREIAGDRQSRRGSLLQGTVFVLLLGIFSVKPELWLAADPKAIVMFAFLPGVAAAAIAADAFAGERERKTLDTLLASPLEERAILAGKAAAAVTFGMTVGALGLLVAIATVSVGHHGYAPSLALVGAVLGASFASALLMSAVAVIVSMVVPVARASQQIASISSALFLALGVFLWEANHIERTWRAAFCAEVFVAIVAVAALEIASATFRRERFFRQR